MGCKTSVEFLGLKRRDARAKRQSAEKKTGAEHARPDVVSHPYEEGQCAAAKGVAPRNPYNPNSSAYEAWQAGYDGE